MKLRQTPDDFFVEELPTVGPRPAGHFGFYRLEKRSWTTHDALDLLRRAWKFPPNRLSYGGLKDRHAHTVQYLSIAGGPERDFKQFDVAVTHLGRLDAPYTSDDFRGNAFRLTLRAMTPQAAEGAAATLAEVAEVGVVNYFDDQRFGSVPPSDEFIARALVAGDFEAALKLALTGYYPHDRPEAKRDKKRLLAHWADLSPLADDLPRGDSRRPVQHLLRNPGDFRGALAHLKPALLSLYLAAYQSHVWNRAAARWLAGIVPPEDRVTVPLRLGDHPMPRRVAPEHREAWEAGTLPLPSSRVHLADDDPRLPLLEATLAEDGLSLATMKIPGMREPFFSKGERPLREWPKHLKHRVEADELAPKRRKLVLEFELGRGSYATMIVKRVSQSRASVEFP